VASFEIYRAAPLVPLAVPGRRGRDRGDGGGLHRPGRRPEGHRLHQGVGRAKDPTLTVRADIDALSMPANRPTRRSASHRATGRRDRSRRRADGRVDVRLHRHGVRAGLEGVGRLRRHTHGRDPCRGPGVRVRLPRQLLRWAEGVEDAPRRHGHRPTASPGWPTPSSMNTCAAPTHGSAAAKASALARRSPAWRPGLLVLGTPRRARRHGAAKAGWSPSGSRLATRLKGATRTRASEAPRFA
jgi:hypothetical protein